MLNKIWAGFFLVAFVVALVKWAFRTTKVAHVIAETAPENAASVRVLVKLGFLQVGVGLEPGTVRWSLPRAGEPVDSGLEVI